MANRFEQVDQPVADAVTVILKQRADGQWAKVACPKRAHPSLVDDEISESLPPTYALSNAVKLANALKIEVVVVDPNGIWKKEWGKLFVDEDGDASA
jgi:hypothetical protein